MKRGFYTIMSAQFFSSLADNALLISAIALLTSMQAPSWMQPLLKFFFVVSYVLLAAFVGAFADSLPKGRVMFFTNLIKISGCLMMFLGVHPLLAYAVVGLGAAAYSPAKYGILTELLPAEKLVAANGWIEGLTVLSIILGTVFGGQLIGPNIAPKLLNLDFPFVDFPIYSANDAALTVIMGLYFIATVFNLKIPDTGARYAKQPTNPIKLISDFAQCNAKLWRDKLGRISLSVTTLFWGASAALQFIVLKWGEEALNLPLHQATNLQGVVAIGVTIGAVVAARFIALKRSLSTLNIGMAMGFIVILMVFVKDIWLACILLTIVGALAGFFVVPMNALLQHRGHILMSAGHSIAVQNFNENLSILVMIGLYSGMIKLDFGINYIIVAFGLFVAGTMYMVRQHHRANQRVFDSEALIGEAKH